MLHQTASEWKDMSGAQLAEVETGRVARPAHDARGPDRRWVALALALHLLLGVAYSVVTPPWEAHDEWGHYKYVEHVARQRALPRPGIPLTAELCCDQADQPPLYYLLAALPVALVDTSDGVTVEVNPYMSVSGGVGGNNATLHDPQAERFPWRGTYLALHLARLVSVAISVVGVVAAYRLTQLLAPGRRDVALAALALAAFWPQYLFIGSVVTNDILIAALGCVIAWLAVRVALCGPAPGPVLGLSLAAGLALLTKASALALLPVVLLALAIAPRARRLRTALSRVTSVALALGVLAVVLGAVFWLWNNHRLTGYILPRYPWFPYWFLERLSGRGQVEFGAGWPGLGAFLRYGYLTTWASFGWGNLGADSWVYGLFTLLAVGGVTGLAAGWVRARPARRRLLGAGVLLALLVSLIALVGGREFLYGTHRLRGRMLLPGLAAMAALLALGWGEWARRLPARWRGWWPGALGAALVGVNLLLALWLIPAAYAPPALLREAELQPGEQPLLARFGESAELVGYAVQPARATPGQSVAVTLLWRALGPFDANYTLAVHLLTAEGELAGGLNIYPGRGNYPTRLWRAGDVFRETYRVPVTESPAQPILANIHVAFFLPGPGLRALPAFDAAGRPIGRAAAFGRIKLAPATMPTYLPGGPELASLGDHIALLAAQQEPAGAAVAGGTLELTLIWEALGAPADDYIVFVHLVGPAGIVAQGDGPPVGGAYPTDLWEKGERIADSHRVQLPADLPAGEYRWRVGLYRQDGSRALAVDPSGTRWPDDQVVLGKPVVVLVP